MRNILLVKIRAYSGLSLLDNLKEHNITIYKFKIIEEYTFLVGTDLYNEKKLKELYKDLKVVKYGGLLGRLKRLATTKITLIAFLISLLFFADLSSRVSDIRVEGTNRKMSAAITERVKELGLIKYVRKPSYQSLIEIENTIKKDFESNVDFVEIRLKGTIVTIRYQTRKESVTVPNVEGSKYANKNGIIAYFVLSSGVKMVEENQYVTEGTLLVSDTILSSTGEEIKIGAYGQVYAKTWTIIEIRDHYAFDQGEAFLSAIQKAKEIMCQGFYLDEKIIDENVLQFNYQENGDYFLKIHFTCLEDIGN